LADLIAHMHTPALLTEGSATPNRQKNKHTIMLGSVDSRERGRMMGALEIDMQTC